MQKTLDVCQSKPFLGSKTRTSKRNHQQIFVYNFQVFETISKITPDRLTPGAKKKIMEN